MNPVRCPLDEASERYPQQVALLSSEIEITFKELNEWVSGTASRLQEIGIQKGERVALILPPSWEQVVLILALIRRGAMASPVNPKFPTTYTKTLLNKISCHRVIGTTQQVARQSKIPKNKIELDQPATILFTSGSSGTPKAVLHSYGNHYWSAKGSNENIPLQRGDRWLLSLPLCHVSGIGIIFRSLLSGTTLVIPREEDPLEERISKYAITHLSLVSTQLYRLLQKATPWKTIKATLLGGSAIPFSILDQAYSKKLPIYTSYGLTEMATQVTTTPSNPPKEKRQTSGKALPYREIDIAKDGEILVRGKTLFQGYVDREKIDRPLTKKGWFQTGDLGEIDPEGYLSVRGRKDNLFISGGENIYPEEIELALSNLAGIEQSRVVPIADKEFGYRPVAFLKTTQPMDSSKIQSELEKALPRFKIPIVFHAWPNVDNTGIKTGRSYFIELARQLKG
jgi:O-succinylbenzoic acid--CoA ligase